MNSQQYTIDSFSVENYRSFGERQTINFNNTITAIYGSNAAGKTNFYKALSTFVNFIKKSTDPSSYGVPYDPFLLLEGMNEKPSTFSMDFHNNQNKYRYTFSLLKDKVTDEAMYDLTSSRSRVIFERTNTSTDAAARNGFGKKLFEGEDAVRDDSLLITLAQRTKNQYANAVFDAIMHLNRVMMNDIQSFRNIAAEILQKNTMVRARLLDFLKKADFTIKDFSCNISNITPEMLAGLAMPDDVKDQLVKNGKNVSISTIHAVRNLQGDRVGSIVFDMDRQESMGTNNFLVIATMFIDTILGGGTLYVDEFGASLNSAICEFLLKTFREEGSKTGARLIINTHDRSLIKDHSIGVLEKNEIQIVERDMLEQTRIIPLTRRMLRTDENYSKKFALGAYGGVPIMESA